MKILKRKLILGLCFNPGLNTYNIQNMYQFPHIDYNDHILCPMYWTITQGSSVLSRDCEFQSRVLLACGVLQALAFCICSLLSFETIWFQSSGPLQIFTCLSTVFLVFSGVSKILHILNQTALIFGSFSRGVLPIPLVSSCLLPQFPFFHEQH